MERARVRVAHLEAAVQLLDVEDPALPPLREALMKARAQASAPPLTDQIASSELYVARKKKRLEEAEQGILEAVRKRDVLKAEVVAGEERLARLKDDLEMSRSSTVPGVLTPSTDLQAEVQKLRVAVVELTRERDLFKAEAEEPARKKFVTGTQHMGVPPVPNTLIPGELHEWVVARQRFDERLVIWSGGHSGRVDKAGPRRCHTNEGTDDAGPSVCGCEHGSMSAVRWCRAVNALYGYRGVRVGEASHPGPKNKRRRRVAESSEDSGSGLVPTLLDEQDSAVPYTEIDMTVGDSLQGVSVPREVIRALEEDLCCLPRASRRVVLAPQSPEGTPQSVHDRRDPVSPTGGQAELSAPSVYAPPTIPASSGAVRRLVLVHNSQDVRSIAPVTDMTMVDTEDVPTPATSTGPATSVQVRVLFEEEGRRRSPVDRLVVSSHVDSTGFGEMVNTTQFDMTAGDTDLEDVQSEAAIPEEVPTTPVRPRRRLVLLPRGARNEAMVSGSDTESLGSDARGGASEGDSQVEEEEPEPSFPQPVSIAPRRLDVIHGLQSLDGVDLKAMFSRREVVMKSVPKFLQGAWRAALRIALEEVCTGCQVGDITRQTRGWKLFFLLPRMLLHKKPRGGAIPRQKLEERFVRFVSGRWLDLVESAQQAEEQAHQSSVRRRRRQSTDDLAKRAERAVSLVQMGEVSRARQALEGAQMAPGTVATLRDLTDPRKRPPVPREALSRTIQEFQPRERFVLDAEKFLMVVRTAKRGAAAGPSSMTADHLFPLLESETDSGRLVELAQILAVGDVPPEIMRAIALGRLTALRKDVGGVRGIVVGDMLRRMVARTVAQQLSKEVEEATSPFQYALTTRAGCECVAHVLQTLTDLDEHATIVSIDGIGAYDLISRQSMLDGLSAMENGEKLLLFVRSFYGAPSTYLWEDEMGTTHEVRQGEGGEQGDPLMPLLFSLGQHRALVAVQARLREGERLFAFLDDVYVICAPDRAGDVHKILQEELWRHAKIQVHHGKTKMWNRSGTPAGVEELTASARVLDPNALVWRGNHALPTSSRGFKVLGVPIGHPDFVEEFLARKTREHELLFERIPAMEDLQSAWLVLLFCAAPRANFWLRSVRPELVQQFAASHDANTWGCLARLIGVQEPSAHSQVMASLQFSFGVWR